MKGWINFKKEELELKKQMLQQEAEKNEAMMKLMAQQLQQQQKQMDGFHTMMITRFYKFDDIEPCLLVVLLILTVYFKCIECQQFSQTLYFKKSI